MKRQRITKKDSEVTMALKKKISQFFSHLHLEERDSTKDPEVFLSMNALSSVEKAIQEILDSVDEAIDYEQLKELLQKHAVANLLSITQINVIAHCLQADVLPAKTVECTEPRTVPRDVECHQKAKIRYKNGRFDITPNQISELSESIGDTPSNVKISFDVRKTNRSNTFRDSKSGSIRYLFQRKMTMVTPSVRKKVSYKNSLQRLPMDLEETETELIKRIDELRAGMLVQKEGLRKMNTFVETQTRKREKMAELSEIKTQKVEVSPIYDRYLKPTSLFENGTFGVSTQPNGDQLYAKDHITVKARTKRLAVVKGKTQAYTDMIEYAQESRAYREAEAHNLDSPIQLSLERMNTRRFTFQPTKADLVINQEKLATFDVDKQKITNLISAEKVVPLFKNRAFIGDFINPAFGVTYKENEQGGGERNYFLTAGTFNQSPDMKGRMAMTDLRSLQ